MQIELTDGKKPVLLRGADGQFEICYKKNVKDKETKVVTEVWQAEKYHASLPAALDSLLKMKVSNSTASTLEELHLEIKKCRKELTNLYGTDL